LMATGIIRPSIYVLSVCVVPNLIIIIIIIIIISSLRMKCRMKMSEEI